MDREHFCYKNKICPLCKKKCCEKCSTGYIKNSHKYYICDRHPEYFFYEPDEKEHYELHT